MLCSRKIDSVIEPLPPGFSIVLTGTIIPNSSFVARGEVEKRRQDYLNAIKHYTRYGPVIFLENSSHDLLHDGAFSGIPNLELRKFPASANPHRGKGYQEFEMMDAWIASNQNLPDRFIKITGRYLVCNFNDICRDCQQLQHAPFVMDLYRSRKFAATNLFGASAESYRKYFLGKYRECDDDTGLWIERVLFKHIRNESIETHLFPHEPYIAGISGSSGKNLAPNPVSYVFKKIRRRICHLLNRREL